ncbi:MAG: DUF4350 domain-containing protein, partial [Bifidobacteriaceae bacterium]|nr:DUF4350 domain-containing protein [Bifidobacteriaceae bacterium]
MTGPAPFPGVTSHFAETRPKRAGAGRVALWTVVVAVPALALLALAALMSPPRDTVPYSAGNHRADGARALLQVLGRQGVEVVTPASAAWAADLAGPGTTLAVAGGADLSDSQLDALEGASGDIVLIDPSADTLLRLGRASLAAQQPWTDGGGPAEAEAGCDDPDARAAGALAGEGTGFAADPGSGATLCFVRGEDGLDGLDAVGGLGGFAVAPGTPRVVALNGSAVLNGSVRS